MISTRSMLSPSFRPVATHPGISLFEFRDVASLWSERVEHVYRVINILYLGGIVF